MILYLLLFLKFIFYSLFRKDELNWSNDDHKDAKIMFQKISISNLFRKFPLRNPKKKSIMDSINQQSDKIKKKFIEHQISILEWFLKDHVTLKNDAESSALQSQE